MAHRPEDDPKDQQAEVAEPSDNEEALPGDDVEVAQNDLGADGTETLQGDATEILPLSAGSSDDEGSSLNLSDE